MSQALEKKEIVCAKVFSLYRKILRSFAKKLFCAAFDFWKLLRLFLSELACFINIWQRWLESWIDTFFNIFHINRNKYIK